MHVVVFTNHSLHLLSSATSVQSESSTNLCRTGGVLPQNNPAIFNVLNLKSVQFSTSNGPFPLVWLSSTQLTTAVHVLLFFFSTSIQHLAPGTFLVSGPYKLLLCVFSSAALWMTYLQNKMLLLPLHFLCIENSAGGYVKNKWLKRFRGLKHQYHFVYVQACRLFNSAFCLWWSMLSGALCWPAEIFCPDSVLTINQFKACCSPVNENKYLLLYQFPGC